MIIVTLKVNEIEKGRDTSQTVIRSLAIYLHWQISSEEPAKSISDGCIDRVGLEVLRELALSSLSFAAFSPSLSLPIETVHRQSLLTDLSSPNLAHRDYETHSGHQVTLRWSLLPWCLKSFSKLFLFLLILGPKKTRDWIIWIMLLQQNWVSSHWAWQSLGKSFLLFVCLILQTADLEARRGHQFVWKTGRKKICWLIY